jgi:hypothetical protein
MLFVMSTEDGNYAVLLRRNITPHLAFSAFAAAQNMNVGFAFAAFEHSGRYNVVVAEGRFAYGAESLRMPVQAVHAALDVHDTVLAPGNGKEGRCFQLIAFHKF